MSKLSYRTLFMAKNTVTKEILEHKESCDTCVTFCIMLKKDMDFNKFCTFTSQSCKNEKKIRFYSIFFCLFWAAFHSLKHENSILAE